MLFPSFERGSGVTKKKTTIMGLVSGLLCALAVFAFTQSIQAQAETERTAALQRYGGEQIEVCVATRDIAAGETVGSSNTAMKMWLADLLPEDSVSDQSEVMGKQTTSSIVSGEVLTKKRFEKNAASIDVPQGMYAVSVPAEEVGAVGGAVGAGMKVDIYLTGNTETSLLAKDTLVLATSAGSSDAGTTKKVSWVTLAIRPESVQEFIAASERGDLYFALPGSSKGE